MKRPNIPSMDEIETMLQDINDMEEAIAELKNRLKEMPSKMSNEIHDQEERISAARYLYWMVQEIPGTTISEGFLYANLYEMTKAIGTATGVIQCDRCSNPMVFRSRSHFKETISKMERSKKKGYFIYAEGYKVLCDLCWKEIQKTRHEQYETQKAKENSRLHELITMPYREYLRTPEWQGRRRQHLQSSSYRCQLCNSKDVILNVHHRTYERRGREYYKDLITLCEDCHKTFHQQRKLAGI